MKYTGLGFDLWLKEVASLAEAWIEIYSSTMSLAPFSVASLAEAWIEIQAKEIVFPFLFVASLAEAWIEIAKACFVLHGQRGRLPRGGVD